MAKLKTERIIIKDEDGEKFLDFKVDVNVDQDGCFTTTFPKEVAERFIELGIDLRTNGRSNGRPGYFVGKTLDDLIKSVRVACEAFTSRTLVSEVLLIRYIIETVSSYVRIGNELYPNGGMAQRQSGVEYGTGECYWRSGTIEAHAQTPLPFGFRIWTEICWKREYSYNGRPNKIEYDEIHAFGSSNDFLDKPETPNLYWLSSVVSIKPPKGDMQEIEAKEDVAEFFVNLYKTIFMITERVNEFVTPEGIKALIANKKGPNLLS